MNLNCKTRAIWATPKRKSTRADCARKVFLSAALLGLLLLEGCGTKPDEGPGTINFIIESSPTNLDPRIGTDAQSEYLDGIIFNSLVTRDNQMNIVPDLAESWEQPDPLTYVFHLQTGVQFQDGRPFTSADVKYTFDSILSGAVKTAKRGTYLMIQSIETPDDATVVFHLREPYASFLWNLAPVAQGIGIVPNGSGMELSQHPIGTGPFRFVSMSQDDDVLLERNPNYFKDAPAPDPGSQNAAPASPAGNIQRVRFKVVPDAIVRALELRKGTSDIAEINSLTSDTVAALAKERNIVLDEKPGTSLAYVAMNFDDPILAHREVRQALAYATDRGSLIRYLLRDQAHPAQTLLPPGNWAFDPNVRQYDYDPSQAERLLDEAGFPRRADGVRFHLELKTTTEESTRLEGEVLADQWKKIGVVLQTRPLETATFLADIGRGSFQLYTLRWIGSNNDPDIFEYLFNSKSIPPDGANRGHYRNPALDALLDQQRVEPDREKRKAILSRIQKVVAEDEPYITLWFYDSVCVHRDRLTNIVVPPVGGFEFLTQAQLQP